MINVAKAAGGGDSGNGGDSTSNATYTLTLVDTEGNPVVGAKAQVCSSATCHGFPSTTDAQGKITFTVPYDATNKLQLNSVPTGYVMPESGTLGVADGTNLPIYSFDTNNSVTVVIELVPTGDDDDNNGGDDGNGGETSTASYTVTVIDANGNGISGVQVKICSDTACNGATIGTDAQGNATFTDITYDATNKLVITAVPFGYTLPESGTAGTYETSFPAYSFDSENTVTVIITVSGNGGNGIDLPDQNFDPDEE